MKYIHRTLCLCILVFCITAYNIPSFSEKKTSQNAGFALVELFTSEGCSSCPPADEAVGRLKGLNKNVFILSFHVDYWNYLGWKDIFSNPSYSSRQQEYGSFFHLNSIYTPQIIVNGKVEFVGSNETKLRETIEESVKEVPYAEIHLIIQSENKNQITVSITSDENPDQKLNLALVQNFSSDFIQRGENKGQTLRHYFTVRDFQVQSSLKGPHTFHLSIPEGLKSSDCTIIAFVQNSKNGHITAATNAAIP